jgi:hypothetical protein
MAQNIQNFDISKTFANVVLTTVEASPDTNGVPNSFLPYPYTGNTALRDQGRLQDGSGNEIPLVLSRNLIEVEAAPASAYSVVRRADIVGMHAAMFINSLIWS